METVSVPVPPYKMPPPLVVVELLFRMELETLRVPALLKAPPLPEEIFAPETFTPEMLRFPPVSISKIRKLPLFALMVRVEAPGPVMVRVPRVPAPTVSLALRI